MLYIDKRLSDLCEVGEIGAYQKQKLLELMQRVSSSLTQSFKNIRKGVDEVMNVAILRTQADEILEQGIEQGIEQGEKKGQQETLVSSIKNVMDSLQCNIERAMDVIKIPQDQRNMYAGLVENSL